MTSGAYKKLRRPFDFNDGTITARTGWTKGGKLVDVFTGAAPLQEGQPVGVVGDYKVGPVTATVREIGIVNSDSGDFTVNADGTRKGTVVLHGTIQTCIVNAATSPGQRLTVPASGATVSNGLPVYAPVATADADPNILRIALQTGTAQGKIDYIEV